MTTRVAVNGYGVIGKRVADAVAAMPDMELVGVADVASDWRIQTAIGRGSRCVRRHRTGHRPHGRRRYRPRRQPRRPSREGRCGRGYHAQGRGRGNLARYRELGVKAILQGGEAHAVTGHSFVAQANYATAIGRDATRVVSCNTTSIVRVLGALHDAELLSQARGVLIRRATDPGESHLGGVMNTMVPESTTPSHQGPDTRTVIPDLDVVTIAAKAAHTQTHMHFWTIKLSRPATKDQVLEALRAAPRIAFIRTTDGLVALNTTVELMKDLGRPRGDMWEVALWEDVLTVERDEAYLTYQVYDEAIVVPETIDAIRALTGTVHDGAKSIAITDEVLVIRHHFLPRSPLSSVQPPAPA